MTRSVEIPQEAVEAAFRRWNGMHVGTVKDRLRDVLGAALPYLAPAGHADPHLDERGKCLCYCGDCINETWCFCGECVDAPHRLTCLPPVGDGGLREALERLATKYANESGTVSFQWLSEKTLKPLLAAHPAAPAVPQPADERPLRAALERYFSDGGPDTPIRTMWHKSVEHWEAPAEDIRELIAGSAVPQPVDREALRERIAVVLHDSQCPDRRCEPTVMGAYYAQADAVLAVLAGEQEQVEP